MPDGKALKAVARKRLEVIYAVMRDKVALRGLARRWRNGLSASPGDGGQAKPAPPATGRDKGVVDKTIGAPSYHRPGILEAFGIVIRYSQ